MLACELREITKRNLKLFKKMKGIQSKFSRTDDSQVDTHIIVQFCHQL